MKPPFLTIVAAMARNRVIGGDNRLLWHLPSDLKHFKKLTLGRPVIMGRKTFASIGRALPGRETIVLTRDRSFAAAGVFVAHEIGAARQLGSERAQAMGVSEIMLVGGGELYAALIDRADRLHLTEVALEPQGDTFFPPIDPTLWREVSRHAPELAAGDEAAFQFVSYETRRAPA